MSLRFAYNTNGLQNHRLEDAVEFVADAGYDGIALTLDIHHLDPFAPDLPGRVAALKRRLQKRGLGTVIETGARFLLDPRAKHEPTLLSDDPSGRLDFLTRAAEIASELGSDCVSCWSGIGPADRRPQLVEQLGTLVERARELGTEIAFEPEPGMLVETVDDWRAVADEVPGLRLALDTGHLLVTEERTPPEAVREFAPVLGTVTVEDMRRGEHVHLPFGEGDMDLPPVLEALREIAFERLVCVELSRDSHRAHEVMPATLATLRA